MLDSPCCFNHLRESTFTKLLKFSERNPLIISIVF